MMFTASQNSANKRAAIAAERVREADVRQNVSCAQFLYFTGNWTHCLG